MQKNKIIKIILISIVMIITLINFINVAYAAVDPAENPGYYNPTQSTTNDSKLTEKVGVILGIINVVGIVVSVITLMVVGIKYMFGSIDEKAEYKKTAITYFIGAALVFGVTTIPNILYRIGQNVQNI